MNTYINSVEQDKNNKLFIDFINEVIVKKSKRMSSNYSNNYKTLIDHINNFSTQQNAIIFTNSINEEFIDDFIIYLESCNLRVTYIIGLISLIKSMIKKAAAYGYNIDQTYDNVRLRNEQSFSIYLTMNDIIRIYYFKGLSKKEERIRDLFIIGCLTGLRYSDYSTLTIENFQGNYIIKTTKKTKKKVIIPMHDYVKEIYEKYNGNVSSQLSIQHFNRYIKLICKKIGFIEDVTTSYTKGGQLVSFTYPKWHYISSHTARRSAATNMYLTGRFKTYEIMSITGHTTEKSFFRYIKISEEDISRQISNDRFFRK